MDILKPDLQYIDGICYRVNPGNHSQDFEKGIPVPYEFDSEPLPETEIDDKFEVVTLDNGRLRTEFPVPSLFFPYLIGAKGATKKRIENETKTIITIPRQGQEGNVVITGSSKQNLSSARNRINMLAISARKKMRPTHFISMPLTAETFQKRFLEFKKNVLECCPEVQEKYFQVPEKLHITLDMLKICDYAERSVVGKVFDDCIKEVIQPIVMNKPLKVKMKGIECMNDDPSAVTVVYATVFASDESDILQTLCDRIVLYFQNKGLLDNMRDRVLIHSTLFNTVFGSADNEGSKKITCNATKVFELFGDFDFGEDLIDRIDISIRHSGKGGYYSATATCGLPC